MNKTPIKMKPCVVKLDQLLITPKAQQLGLSAELRNVINERNILTAKTKQRFINDLNDINKPSQTEITRKNKAFQEILDTELAYVSQLEVLMKFFMEPIDDRGLMSKKEFEVVFGNVQTLYKVHEELVEELKNNLSNLAEAFLRLAPFFKLYSVYAYNYKKALQILENLYKTNKIYAKFVNNQETRPEVHTKLTSLLIAPIQRIPRYCLLLKQVLENSRRTDPDYKGISESLKHVRIATIHINNHIENNEHTERLLQLQTILHKGKSIVIKPGRKLLKEGALKELITKQKHAKVYLILFTDTLLICECVKRDLTVKHSLKVGRVFPLHKCRVRADSRMKIIEIMCEGNTCNVFDDTGSKTDEWLENIEEAIRDCINNRQTLKRDVMGSVRRLATGQKRQRESEETTTMAKKIKRQFSIHFGNEIEVAKPSTPAPTKSVHFSQLPPNSPKQNTFSSSSSYFKLCSRKPITSSSPDSDESNTNKSKSVDRVLTNGGHSPSMRVDSLYPLRRHLSVDRTSNELLSNHTMDVYKENDLFVFGANNSSNRGFNISNVFTGIGSSIKRFFGYN